MLIGENIILRPFCKEDAQLISEMRNDFKKQQAAGGSPFPSNVTSEEEWISKMYPAGILTNIYFAIEENETKLFIGYCSALNINYVNRNSHVGFFFHKKGRGKGYFKEAQILFYKYLFNEINLKKVYSYALSYNDVAIKVDRQIGFVEEGIMKEHIYQNGKYHDAIILSLTKEDFFNRDKQKIVLGY